MLGGARELTWGEALKCRRRSLLHKWPFLTVADLRRMELATLKGRFGCYAVRLYLSQFPKEALACGFLIEQPKNHPRKHAQK
jgi:hypothetical protein